MNYFTSIITFCFVNCAFGNVCDANAACENSTGSIVCTCNSGFTGDGSHGSCSDVNECLNSNICPNSVCNNIHGSFRCVCYPGTVMINDSCFRK